MTVFDPTEEEENVSFFLRWLPRSFSVHLTDDLLSFSLSLFSASVSSIVLKAQPSSSSLQSKAEEQSNECEIRRMNCPSGRSSKNETNFLLCASSCCLREVLLFLHSVGCILMYSSLLYYYLMYGLCIHIYLKFWAAATEIVSSTNPDTVNYAAQFGSDEFI